MVAGRRRVTAGLLALVSGLAAAPVQSQAVPSGLSAIAQAAAQRGVVAAGQERYTGLPRQVGLGFRDLAGDVGVSAGLDGLLVLRERDVALGGETRRVSVLFCDIRSFSRISETARKKSAPVRSILLMNATRGTLYLFA